jgi:hypothetical protein
MSKPGSYEVVGVWEPDEQRIVIKRSQLQSLAEFAGTLLHEVAHATTDAPDVSEPFERELTEFLGRTAVKGLPAKVNSADKKRAARKPTKTQPSKGRKSRKKAS